MTSLTHFVDQKNKGNGPSVFYNNPDDTDSDDERAGILDDVGNFPSVANNNLEDTDDSTTVGDNTSGDDEDDDDMLDEDSNSPSVASDNLEDTDDSTNGYSGDDEHNDNIPDSDSNSPSVANDNIEDTDDSTNGYSGDDEHNDNIPDSDSNSPSVANDNLEGTDDSTTGYSGDDEHNDNIPDSDDNSPSIANDNDEDTDSSTTGNGGEEQATGSNRGIRTEQNRGLPLNSNRGQALIVYLVPRFPVIYFLNARKNIPSPMVIQEIEELKMKVYIPVNWLIHPDMLCRLETLTLRDLLKIEETLCIHLFAQFMMCGAPADILMHDLIMDIRRLEQANRIDEILPLSDFISFKTTESGFPLREVSHQ